MNREALYGLLKRLTLRQLLIVIKAFRGQTFNQATVGKNYTLMSNHDLREYLLDHLTTDTRKKLVEQLTLNMLAGIMPGNLGQSESASGAGTGDQEGTEGSSETQESEAQGQASAEGGADSNEGDEANATAGAGDEPSDEQGDGSGDQSGDDDEDPDADLDDEDSDSQASDGSDFEDDPDSDLDDIDSEYDEDGGEPDDDGEPQDAAPSEPTPQEQAATKQAEQQVGQLFNDAIRTIAHDEDIKERANYPAPVNLKRFAKRLEKRNLSKVGDLGTGTSGTESLAAILASGIPQAAAILKASQTKGESFHPVIFPQLLALMS